MVTARPSRVPTAQPLVAVSSRMVSPRFPPWLGAVPHLERDMGTLLCSGAVHVLPHITHTSGPVGKRAVVGYEDGTIRIWDLKQGSPIHVLKGMGGWGMKSGLDSSWMKHILYSRMKSEPTMAS